MKIEGPNKATGPKGVSKGGNRKDGDNAFGSLVSDMDEAETAAPTARPSSLGALDTLLALQGFGDATSEEATKRAKKRAIDLLDHLDQMRMGLLTGELAADNIRQLTQTLAAHRDQITDPGLVEVLDEIDLRAQVELAKLGL